MFNLKKYQQKSIDEFEFYINQTKQLEASGITDSYKIAFSTITGEPYKKSDPDLEVPFVCIKIPTGGGKTVVACNMINTIHENFVQFDNSGLVLWLVPSDAIRTQTLKSLRDKRHPYRETLDKFFQNNVSIYETSEALKNLKKTELDNGLVILVSTLSAFRREQKNKNYA